MEVEVVEVDTTGLIVGLLEEVSEPSNPALHHPPEKFTQRITMK